MKKISLLKKLGIGLAPVAIATPLIFTTTSCSKNEGILVNYISHTRFQEDESLVHMHHGHFDNDELLLGSKKFFNGNYIMFVGSNAYRSKDLEPSSTAKFFGSDGNRNIDN
ncbi:MAG: hypothetical protein MJ200_00635 [Mycoplasmoidaceae bacterium]|nr:hypothetical protein [Mycoplasmoidaceae bacterium]